MERRKQEIRFLDLVELRLPARARRCGWVVIDDHMFKRIVLDHVFNDRWTHHLDRGIHPEQKLNDTQLSLAIAISERMLASDASEALGMYRKSVQWHQLTEDFLGRPAFRMPMSRARNVRPPITIAR
ncbi:MAG: hypothetical protein V3V20_04110 [Algisphaera sp.]